MDDFYNYVKELIKSEPSTAYVNLTDLKISDDDFYDNINKNYEITLLSFNNIITYNEIKSNGDLSLNEHVKYRFKLDNQLYAEYTIFSDDNEKHYVNTVHISSSIRNKDEILKFVQFLNNYVKKINKIK